MADIPLTFKALQERRAAEAARAEERAAQGKKGASHAVKSGSGGTDIVGKDSRNRQIVKIQIGKGNYTGTLGEQFAQLARDFKFYCDHFDSGMVDVLAEALEPTLVLSEKYCPKDTHTLVNSAYLEVELFRGNPRVEIGYARAGDPHYAIIVHEDPSKTHEPPTRYKFLEAAIDEDWGGVTLRIAQGAKKLGGFV